MQAGDLFVEMFRQVINPHLVFVLPKVELSHHLVGEGVAHHERRMAGGTTQVHEAAFRQDEDGVTVGEDVLIHLRLDVALGDVRLAFERADLYFVVEVTDVADDGLIFHLVEMIHGDDIAVAGTGDVDVALVERVFHGLHLETFHSGLQSTDRVNFGNDDAGAVGTHGLRATLTHIAVAAHHDHFAGHHHVGGALDAVGERLAATVFVVEFGFRHGVVDVDGGEEQLAALHHLIETMHTGGGFLGNTLDLLHHIVPMVRIFFQHLLQRVEDNSLLVGFGFGIEDGRVIFGFATEVDEQGGVTAVIDDELRTLAAGERKGVHRTPPVIFEAFALPGEHAHTVVGDGRGGVILRGEDVAAAPTHFRAEVRQRLDQHGRLDSHVQRAHDTNSFQRFAVTIFLTDSQQARHLFLGNIDVFVSPFRQIHIGDFVFQITVNHIVTNSIYDKN